MNSHQESPSPSGEGLGWGSLTEKELIARAKELRKNPTEWEIRLWNHLSNSQLNGFKFRRQAVIFPYIADFFCPSKGLIIELDGDTHVRTADARRDAILAKRGFETLRFWNTDVKDSLEGVVNMIGAKLTKRPDRWSRLPHPNPVWPVLVRPGDGLGQTPEGEGL